MGCEHVRNFTLYFSWHGDLALIFHLISDSPNLMVWFFVLCLFLRPPPFHLRLHLFQDYEVGFFVRLWKFELAVCD